MTLLVLSILLSLDICIGALSVAPLFSYHACHGNTDITRSCLFENLYYHIPSKTYVYHERPDEPASIKMFGQFHQYTTFGANEVYPGIDPYFVTKNFITLRWPGGEAAFNLASNRSLPPPLAAVHHIEGVSLLWHFNGLSSYSYGHCLIVDWLPLHLTLSHHFHPHPQRLQVFDLFNCFHPDRTDWYPTVCAHYVSNYVNASVINFVEFANHTHNVIGREWLLFDRVVVGEGGMTLEGNHQLIYTHHAARAPSPLFTSHNWYELRKLTLQRNGLPPEAVVPLRPHIFVRTYGHWERRRLDNAHHVIEALRQHFPDVDVSGHDFQDMSPLEQYRLLSNTSILITMQGSASFRHVFLPLGAVAIVIGNPPHSSVINPDNWGYTPFFELGKYFPLAYMRHYKYPVQAANASEYIIKPGDKWTDENGKKWSYYNADVVVSPARLIPFVQRALRDVARARTFHLKRVGGGGKNG